MPLGGTGGSRGPRFATGSKLDSLALLIGQGWLSSVDRVVVMVRYKGFWRRQDSMHDGKDPTVPTYTSNQSGTYHRFKEEWCMCSIIDAKQYRGVVFLEEL